MKNKPKHYSKLAIELVGSKNATSHAGQLVVLAQMEKFGLLDALMSIPGIDVRKKTGYGFSPETFIKQLLFAFTTGGHCINDAQEIGEDKVLCEAIGLTKVAHQSTIGQWLRGLSDETIQGMWDVNAAFVKQVLTVASFDRISHSSGLEIFFDDSQLEVTGKCFEGARKNYNGDIAIGFQALWVSDFIVEAKLGGHATVACCQTSLLKKHRHIWSGKKSHFYADSGSSFATDLDEIENANFTTWSVSYNKWTSALDRLALSVQKNSWTDEHMDEKKTTHSYYSILHTTQRSDNQNTERAFAACRRDFKDDFIASYSYVVHESNSKRTPRQVIEKHKLKGDRERLFEELLSGLDLHHPSCKSLRANQALYALACLAFNLLMSIKVLELRNEDQTWSLRKLMRKLLIIPAIRIAHANQVMLRLFINPLWSNFLTGFLSSFSYKIKNKIPC